jgi:hypothetical protein
MLRLEVLVRPDSSLEVSGVFGEAVSLSESELVPMDQLRFQLPNLVGDPLFLNGRMTGWYTREWANMFA